MIDCNITTNYFNEKKRMGRQASGVVQKWSDEHPRKTYLTELLKNFPNTPLGDDGMPEIICPHHLGLKDIEDCEIDSNCVECWSQIIEDGEER